jgi:hypothetical protein
MLYRYGGINIRKFRGFGHEICKQNRGLKHIYSCIYNSYYAFFIFAMSLSSSFDESSSESELKASFVLLPVFIITLSLFLAYMLSFSKLDIYMLYTTIVSPLSLLSLSIRIAKKEIKV